MSAYTAQDLANIKSAIAGGLTQAMIAGEMVQYRSLAELERIQRKIEGEIIGGAGASPVPFQVRTVMTDRGV